jgi:hypothetical protein
MGDLRNKRRKEAEQARVRAMQAKVDARHPKTLPPRCRCGLTPQQVPVMWLINGADRWSLPDFRCPDCLPANLRGLAIDASHT